MSTLPRDLGILISCVALSTLAPASGAVAAGLTVLHAFGGGTDGATSHAGLLRDSKGNLFGTTQEGGPSGWGTVFEITARGKESVLYSFTGGNDGGNPIGGVIADKSGDLYGATVQGGAEGDGVVFEVTPAGSESVLYTFTGGTDGLNPYCGVVADAAGNLYGTTELGGVNAAGNIFEVTPGGVETVLYSFGCGNDGCVPLAGLAIDKSGNLYGTAAGGGTNNNGVVFELTPNGTFITLYSFSGGSDGWRPRAAPILDGSGNLYGTTALGGGSGCNGYGCGTVYEVTQAGTETILHAFSGGSDGLGPYGSLYLDQSGDVYGATLQGGSGCDFGCGTIFKISPSGSKTLVHAFSETEGADSESNFVADSKGYLYGTTKFAGKYGYGSVFKVKE